MSRKRVGNKNKLAAKRIGRRKALLVIGLLFGSIVASGALAQWSGFFSTRHPQSSDGTEATSQSLLPGSPSKEYVYAGSRLVATEESVSTPGCSYSISPTSQSFPSAGGSGTVAVTAGAGCSWTASSNAPWLRITSGASGSGNGTVAYSVDPNSSAQRAGAIMIAGQTVTINQSAGSSSCSYTLSPPGASAGIAGGSVSVTVLTGGGCSWTVQSNAPWITVTAGGGGATGTGVVTFSIAANSGPARTGTLTIAGQTFTVNQDGSSSSCNYSISPTSGAMGAGGGPGGVNVMTGAGCIWTAQSNAAWITITAGGSGSGNGTVSYQVAANTGAARTGTLTIAGQTFTLSQGAAGAPPAPTLTATALSATSIRIDWTFAPDGISVFKIERKTGTAGTYSQITFADTATRTFTNTKLITHTTYCYRVRAYNGQDGPYSNEACATTP
ncbi:MAG: BACON domain-containing carbohydrate-binding protein [Blastocatellia bacterium]